MLYLAEEVFFVGRRQKSRRSVRLTASPSARGGGPVTLCIQEEFFALTRRKKADRHNWLTPVNAPVAVTA